MKKLIAIVMVSLGLLGVFGLVPATVSASDHLPADQQAAEEADPNNPNAGGGGTTGGSVSPTKAAVCEGVGLTGADCGSTTGPSVDTTVALVVNILSIIVAFAAVVMIIIGGFKYVISSGDSNNINSAKNTILYAIIGLVVVALAQIIVKFVIGRAAAGP